ncbi:MAG: ABC transporter permease [Cyclobacteriaceae bacterium]|nr:ABC transporter permease [Cyclobacteriaceae bacterium]
MKSNPPKLALRFFRWFCHPKLCDSIEGDLMELYEERKIKSGKVKADAHFIKDVLLLFRPGIIKPTEGTQTLNTYGMYKSYFKIGWRNLLKNRGFAVINIGGLAVGVTVAILIGLWIFDEVNYDTYHTNYNRISQVLTRETDEDGTGINTSLPYPLALELKANHADNFKHIVVSTFGIREYILSTEDRNFTKTGQFMDAGAPEMLSLKMIHGSYTALNDPNTIILSASTAQTFFGDSNPVNQLMKINNRLDVKVTGVYEDLPKNTTFADLKFLAPFDLWLVDNPWVKEKAINDWSNHFLKVYTEILPSTDFATVAARIKDAERNGVKDIPEQAAQNPEVFLHPMQDWHLYSFKNSVVNPEPSRIVKLVGLIGALVLVLACINLSTARSEVRAKEVGIRKAIGSLRHQLIGQFLSESFLVVILAFVIAFVLVSLLLPWFNDLTAKQIVLPISSTPFWLMILAIVLVTALLAGMYPASYLSSFKPAKALKGVMRAGKGLYSQRRILVVTQFTISITLIICTIIIYNQIQFAQNRPVGYSREGLIMLEMKGNDLKGKYEILSNELKKAGVVSEVSQSMGKITQVWSNNDGWDWQGRDPALTKSFGTLTITPEHGNVIGWQILQGRDFSNNLVSDSSAIVINEAALNYMGITNVVGERMSWTFNDKTYHYEVIGIVKDMVMESPYQPIRPTIFLMKAPNGKPNWVNIKINPAISTQQALIKIEEVLKKVAPTTPFDYKFVDDEYNAKFLAEVRIGKLASLFSSLAIFISCLGLYGMASFIAEQQTKEIGIRKVLGASITNLCALLSKDFVLLVAISCIVAIPIAYYSMAAWLIKFPYRTELSFWIFIVTCLGALMITLLTISFQAIKTAMENPVKSLRSE